MFFLLLFAVADTPEEVTDRYRAFLEARRPQAIEGMRRYVEVLKQDVAAAKRGIVGSPPAGFTGEYFSSASEKRLSITERQGRLKEVAEELKGVENGTVYPRDPELRPATLKTGSGGLFAKSATVFRIVDDRNALVAIRHEGQSAIVWVAEVSTTGLADGSQFTPGRPFLVTGTKRTGQATVFILFPTK